MAASCWTGQKALQPLPSKSLSIKRTIDNYSLPDSLIQDRVSLHKQENGLPVLKVSKNGKLQTRRLAFTPDRRHILVTTHRIRGGLILKGLFQKAKSPTSSSKDLNNIMNNNVKVIPLAAMDCIHRGSHTHRFVLARKEASLEKDGQTVVQLLDSDSACCSVVYRNQGELETLDLVVPHQADYEVLLTVLESLHALYLEEKQRFAGDINVLHALYVDMGKEWQADLTMSEFLSLCDKLQVPFKKTGLQTIFREECAKYGRDEEMQLTFAAIAQLIDQVRALSVSAAKNPFEKLWMDIMATDPVPPVGWQGGGDSASVEMNAQDREDSISAVAFLSFLRSQQKEYSTSLEEAVDLIHILNQLITPEDLLGKSTPDERNRSDRLSKHRFLAFLTADANDLLHPARAKVGADDMTRPLSQYWINTSHDTYLAPLPTSLHGKNAYQGKGKYGHVVTDEQTYMAALMRGVRCLELDVWDSWDSKEPVLSRLEPKLASDKVTPLETVLRAIRSFLEQQPYSFPVILKLENHCSHLVQLTMTKLLQDLLGSNGLLVRPEVTLDAHTFVLPSPESIRGRVLIIGKRPKVVAPGRMVRKDDFDAENDNYHVRDGKVYEADEDDDLRVVTGFDANGPIRSNDMNEFARSPEDLFAIASDDAERTSKDARDADTRARELLKEAEKQETRAASLTHHSGLSPAEVKRRAALASRGDVYVPESGDESFVEEEKCTKDEGLEVHEVLPDFVNVSQNNYERATNEAMEAAGKEAQCHMLLRDMEEAYTMAKANLDMSCQREKLVAENARRAAAEARTHAEHAESARERVQKVRELLGTSKDQSSSAGNVVQTALTEAKISEKRASDAEARAKRAAAAAEHDRNRAENETRKEEALEQEVNELHHECLKATEAAKACRDRVEKAASMFERVTEQIKLIERSSQYRKELQIANSAFDGQAAPSGDSFMEKHAAKLDERQKCQELIKEASQENSAAEMRRNRLQQGFEEKAYLWKMQAEVAAQARKTADRSSHVSEELAEDAAEEREAANLRHIARQRAEATVENKGSYLESFEAQLAEAERAATEAAAVAANSKKKAEHLEREAEKVKDHSRFEHALLIAEKDKKAALAEYEVAKQEREAKDKVMMEEKRRLDTNSEVYETAAQTVASESDRKRLEQIYQQEAVIAYNQAVVARQQATQAAQAFETAAQEAQTKRLAAKHALEYKQRMDNMVEIPVDLAKMTLLHSSKLDDWKKSIALSNAYVHSVAQNVLLLRVDKNLEEEKGSLHSFTKTHLFRVFPSWREINRKPCSNYDPVFAWALGCQLVSTNFHSTDENLLISEGRFRQNGSCGYALKPPYLIDNISQTEYEQKWTFTILSGFNLPKPEKKVSTINPIVKVSMYSGSAKEMRISYRTKPTEGNGLNPVWTSHNKFSFTIPTPSISMLAFSVWHTADDGAEYFMAAAAFPAAYIREGYRSIALFDANHSRTGSYSSAGLLIKGVRR